MCVHASADPGGCDCPCVLVCLFLRLGCVYVVMLFAEWFVMLFVSAILYLFAFVCVLVVFIFNGVRVCSRSRVCLCVSGFKCLSVCVCV